MMCLSLLRVRLSIQLVVPLVATARLCLRSRTQMLIWGMLLELEKTMGLQVRTFMNVVYCHSMLNSWIAQGQKNQIFRIILRDAY
jgi:hypothetical protein